MCEGQLAHDMDGALNAQDCMFIMTSLEQLNNFARLALKFSHTNFTWSIYHTKLSSFNPSS